MPNNNYHRGESNDFFKITTTLSVIHKDQLKSSSPIANMKDFIYHKFKINLELLNPSLDEETAERLSAQASTLDFSGFEFEGLKPTLNAIIKNFEAEATLIKDKHKT